MCPSLKINVLSCSFKLKTVALLLKLFWLFPLHSVAQQVIINTHMSPQELVNNWLMQGCVEISHAASPLNGSANGLESLGFFERGSSNFPLKNGVVLTTGNAASGGNFNTTAILNDGNDNWGTDPDIETALGVTGTLNASVLEFTFATSVNRLNFNFIYASEEYFATSPCHTSDHIAILIREANSGDPFTNMAVIPDTSTPVNSSSIHDNVTGYCSPKNETFFDGYNLGDTNYNGRTKVITSSMGITPNTFYEVKIIIADQSDSEYDSALFIESNILNPIVDLGDEFITCASTKILDGTINNPKATYRWFLNEVPLVEQNEPVLTANQSGTYKVLVDLPLPNSVCTIEDTIELTLNYYEPITVTDYILCDDSAADQQEVFDLESKTPEIEALLPPSNYNITYYLDKTNALEEAHNIKTPISNTTNPQTIYARIKNTDNGCVSYATFEIKVNPELIINPPTVLIACDGDASGITEIDLTEKNEEVTGGISGLEVTYYHTQTDANSGTNPIESPYTNNKTHEQLFVRVTDTTTQCYKTAPLAIEVRNNNILNEGPFYIDACDGDHDGYAIFNLTTITPEVIGELTNVTVTFYELANDAETGTNPIQNETAYNNILLEEQVVYIRVEDNITGCAAIAPIEIHTNLLLTGTHIRDITFCDADNDSTEAINLNKVETRIVNKIPDITIEFFNTEEDRDTNTNPIDKSKPFTINGDSHTFFISLSNGNCVEVSQFNVRLFEKVQFNNTLSATYCDTNQDRRTTVNLTTFNSLITGGSSGYVVTYFASKADAKSGSNPIKKFKNTSDTFTIYTRVNHPSYCTGSGSIEITVLPAPKTNLPSDILVCDDDQDGISTINLESTTSSLVTDTTNKAFSFHTSKVDAENNTNAIANTTSFTTKTNTVYARVESNETSCAAVVPIKIIVNTRPIIQTISTYKACEPHSDGKGHFYFKTKDNEILNGQKGKRVLYFKTPEDAQNRTHIINKNKAFENTTNPQTINVRIENITDQDCYTTSSFVIMMERSPDFNAPSDMPVCDDITNDGKAVFDLNEKINEITTGINENLDVTFYLTKENAETGLNPLPLNYENTSNPQAIIARIDNNSGCSSFTNFVLSVIPGPLVTLSKPIVKCDSNNDGIVTFNLPEIAKGLLRGRQRDNTISYFKTEADLYNQVNEISNPDTYQNTSRQQTLFLRISNTLTNCFLKVPLKLEVYVKPEINPFKTIEICDTPDKSFYPANINHLVTNETDVIITYYTTKADAEAGENTIAKNYTYQSNNDTLFVRVENKETSCYTIYPFQLIVNPLPLANRPYDLETCDDNYDSLFVFDLAQQTSRILGHQEANNYTVTYHESQSEAEAGTHSLPKQYQASNLQTIYARVQNNTTLCYSTTSFQAIIAPKPIIDIEQQTLCLKKGFLTVSAETHNTSDTYLWSTNQTTPEITINTIGTYWVTVTTSNGCTTNHEFKVIESESANIEIVETLDFSNPNNITITVSGIGNYLYALDDGFPQESNIFENVSLGKHLITVVDSNGCAEITREVMVVDAPKFFTPNNDGYNDTWHITGIETLPGSTVSIFDRYGKFLKQLTSNSTGWDGTCNGLKMPGTDYWFRANIKRGDTAFEVLGHFALKY